MDLSARRVKPRRAPPPSPPPPSSSSNRQTVADRPTDVPSNRFGHCIHSPALARGLLGPLGCSKEGRKEGGSNAPSLAPMSQRPRPLSPSRFSAAAAAVTLCLARLVVGFLPSFLFFVRDSVSSRVQRLARRRRSPLQEQSFSSLCLSPSLSLSRLLHRRPRFLLKLQSRNS